MTVCALAFLAILAAIILVVIPPVPIAVPASPAKASISGVISSTTGISLADGLFLGFAVYNPSISESKMSKSAPTSSVTVAESVSLSPNL